MAGGHEPSPNLLDPSFRQSRRVFQVHRPETLADWLAADTLHAWAGARQARRVGLFTAADDTRSSSHADAHDDAP